MTEAQNLMMQSASYGQEAKAFFEEANWLWRSLEVLPLPEHQQVIKRIAELTRKGLVALQKSSSLNREFINLQRELIQEQKHDYLIK